MKRYVVTDQTAGVTQGLYETIGEVIAAAVHLQELGRKIHIIDAQGSGAIMVNHFDVLFLYAIPNCLILFTTLGVIPTCFDLLKAH